VIQERETDILIVGGGLGGVAGALAALRLGKRVILTEVTDWIGGQLTAQAVPPDEYFEWSQMTPDRRCLENQLRSPQACRSLQPSALCSIQKHNLFGLPKIRETLYSLARQTNTYCSTHFRLS
jgi:hypothetical protein